MTKPVPVQKHGRLIAAGTKIIKKPGLPLILGLCLAASSMVLFWWFSSEVFEGETLAFDESVRQMVLRFATPAITSGMVVLSFLGKLLFFAILGVPLAALFFYLGWRRDLALFAITMAGEILLNILLKGLFERVRPEAFFGYELPASFSFPSGHALGAFCFYGILAWLLTARIKNPWLIWGTRAATLILVLAIGFSRIYLGVHYASDVFAGYLAAVIWLTSVAIGDHFYRGRQREGAN